MQRQSTAEPGRRIRVRRGISYRWTSDGKKRYMIMWPDASKKSGMASATIEGGLREAEAALAEIKTKQAKRTRVVKPTKVTLAEYAEAWLARQTQLRPRTRELYASQLRLHVLPRLGRWKLGLIDADAIAQLVAEMREQGYSPYTIRGALTPLGRVLSHAARRNEITENPMTRLERGERPRAEHREMRVLDTDEIGRLLAAMDETYLPLVATAVFTGLRQGELLGLRWQDIDFDEGLIRVRKQLDRRGQLVEPKTRKAIRDVDLMPTLARLLREHKERAFARGRAKPSDFVFASSVGTPLHYRNVAKRGLEPALKRAGIEGERLRWHDLRHTFASLLIAQGENVVYVSKQLGHASSSITLDVYAKLLDRAEQGRRAAARMDERYGKFVASSGDEQRRIEGGGDVAEVAQLRAIGH